METELFFDSDKKECIKIETNKDLIIYICKDCNFVTMGVNENKCLESRNQHLENTFHTMKRIW